MNAEHSAKTSGFLHTLLWTLFLALLYFVLGTLLYDVALGFVFLAWLLIVGPFFAAPVLVWIYLKFFRSLKLLDLRSSANSDLAQYYFEMLLKKSGPRPIFYTYEAGDLGFFWWENLFSSQPGQIVLLPQRWFEETKSRKRHDFEALWESIHALSPNERKMRTAQMCLWVSFFLPFEFLASIGQNVLNVLGFDDLPPLGFWMYRTLKNFQSLWFQLSDESDPLAGEISRTRLLAPRAWRSLCFGVWSLQPRRSMHPLTRAMTQKDLSLGDLF
jgi:hypothetical protein